jgi:YHS domain-containing protein
MISSPMLEIIQGKGLQSSSLTFMKNVAKPILAKLIIQCLTFFFEPCTIILMYKDPVCSMMVDEKKTQHISQDGGRNVYLCSAACKREFERNSAKYGY